MAIDVKLIISAVDRASGTLKKVGGSLSAFNKQSKNITARFKDIGKNAAIATAGIATIGAGAYKLASDAARFQSVSDAFRSMTQGMIRNQDEFVNKVKKASAGTLSSMDVVSGATKALSLIGKQSFTNFGDDFAKMAMLSKKAARATGQDVNFMFDSLILGVSRSSKLILDNLGITLDMAEAQSKYKDEVMATTGATEVSAEKASLLRVAIEELEKNYGNVATTAGGLAGAQQKLKASMGDLRVEIGTQLLPIFNDLIRNIILPLVEDYLPKLSDWLGKIIGKFQKLPKEVKITAGAFVALLPLISTIGLLLIPLTAGLKAISGLFAIMPGPLKLAVAGLLMWYGVSRLVNKLQEKQKEVLIKSGKAWVDFGKTLLENAKWVTKEVGKAFGDFWDELKPAFKKEATAVLFIFDEFLTRGLVTSLADNLKQIQITQKEFWSNLGLAFKEGTNNLKKIFEDYHKWKVERWKLLGNELKVVSKTMMDNLEFSFSSGLRLAHKIWEGFKDKVLGVLETLKLAVDRARQNFEQAFSLNIRMPDFEGIRRRFEEFRSSLPHFQTGGVIPGSPAQARLAVVHGGERVIPHGGGGGVGGDGITININAGTLISTRTEVREFAKMMYDELANLARAQRKTVDELINWQP